MVKLSELKKCMNCYLSYGEGETKPLKIDWITGYNSSKIVLCDNCWKQIRRIEKTSPRQAETLRSLWQSYISANKLEKYM